MLRLTPVPLEVDEVRDHTEIRSLGPSGPRRVRRAQAAQAVQPTATAVNEEAPPLAKPAANAARVPALGTEVDARPFKALNEEGTAFYWAMQMATQSQVDRSVVQQDAPGLPGGFPARTPIADFLFPEGAQGCVRI